MAILNRSTHRDIIKLDHTQGRHHTQGRACSPPPIDMIDHTNQRAYSLEISGFCA